MPPEHYEGAVARAVERIRAGELEKVVLAREVQRRTRRAPTTPARAARRAARGVPVLLLLLRRHAARRRSSARAPSCSSAARALRAGDASRSPARPGAAPTPPSTTTSASSCCAAPRTARSRRSSRGGSSQALAPARGLGRRRADEPVLVKVANIQHLATPIRAQLRRAASARSSSPALLHPTPAVGGEPLERRRAADPGARGARPRLVRRARSAGWTRTRTASSASRCAARCCAAASPAASPASASSPTPTRRPSWPRPRSSSRRCCRCWRSDRRPDGARRPHLPDRAAGAPAVHGGARGGAARRRPPSSCRLGPVAADAPARWRGERRTAGTLVRGVQFPAESAVAFTWDFPLGVSPSRPWRRWGTEKLVRTLECVLTQADLADPFGQRVGVADLSRPHGGPFGEPLRRPRARIASERARRGRPLPAARRLRVRAGARRASQRRRTVEHVRESAVVDARDRARRPSFSITRREAALSGSVKRDDLPDAEVVARRPSMRRAPSSVARPSPQRSGAIVQPTSIAPRAVDERQLQARRARPARRSAVAGDPEAEAVRVPVRDPARRASRRCAARSSVPPSQRPTRGSPSSAASVVEVAAGRAPQHHALRDELVGRAGAACDRAAARSRAPPAPRRRPPTCARCSATFSARSVRTWIELRPVRREPELDDGAQPGEVVDREQVQPVGLGEPGDVEAVRRRDVRLEVRRSGSATGRKSKIPPPPLSMSTIVSGTPMRRRGQQRARRRGRARRRRSAARPGPGLAAATP